MEIVRGDHGVFEVSPELDPVIYRHLRDYGAQQRGDLEMLLTLLEPGSVVYDVGAHIGTFAIPFARALGPAGRVIAIEGSPDTALSLQQNVNLNDLGHRVTVHHAVVTDGSAEKFQPVRATENRGRTQFARGGTITSLSLDELDAPAPDLLKIDVEGMEPLVLRGAHQHLLRSRPFVFFETNADKEALGETIQWLLSLGYHFFVNAGDRNARRPKYRIAPIHPDRAHEHKDLLAVPTERLQAVGASSRSHHLWRAAFIAHVRLL
ncbi:MAG: FkbM family methyltransferase, partial [Myxococcota bacterium]